MLSRKVQQLNYNPRDFKQNDIHKRAFGFPNALFYAMILCKQKEPHLIRFSLTILYPLVEIQIESDLLSYSNEFV